MLIRDFLTTKTFGPKEPTYMRVDPLVRFAHILDRDGNPERVDSMSRVVVPMAMVDIESENDKIARAMVQVAKGKIYRAQNYAALTPKFWAKLTHHLDAVLLHPEHQGEFTLPTLSKVFYSEAVPLDLLLCLGSKERVGTYLQRGDTWGLFLPHSSGIVGVYLYQAG